MKNRLKILIILALGLFLLSKCEKDPDLKIPDLTIGVVPLVEKDEASDKVIFDNDIAGFSGKVTVNLYYPDDKPKSMDLMVSLDDDPANSAVVIDDITSWPATYDFTVASLVTALPGLNNVSELVAGDYFRFYTNITLDDGTVVNGNDTLYTAFSSGIGNLPNSSTNVVYPVACGYDPALAGGSYFSFSATDQWNSSGNITLTVDPTDNTKINVVGIEAIEGLIEDHGPLVMHINPLTFEVTADHSVIATNAFGYHNIAYEGTGVFNSCDGSYTMDFDISTDEGGFGTFKFTFTRN